MNYSDLFRVTLPETALEIAALVVLAIDLVALRKSNMKTRVFSAILVGLVGCVAALWALQLSAGTGFFFDKLFPLAHGIVRVDRIFVLTEGGTTLVAQTGILVLTALTLILLAGESFTRHIGEFVAVVLMAAAGGLVVASAQDLLVIFVGLELLSLGLYILTAFNKSSGKSAEAAIKYYLFGGMSAAFLLFGFSYLYGLTGSTNLVEIQRTLAQQGPSPLLFVAWILVAAGLGFKIAVVPFYLWAPDTYEGAPAPAAAFIASVSKVASFALLLAFFNSLSLPVPATASLSNSANGFMAHSLLYFGAIKQFTEIMLVVAVLSMVIGNLAALAQTSVRRLLAYSAVAHAGYILLGVCPPPLHLGPVTAPIQTVGMAVVDQHIVLFHLVQQSVLYYVLTYGLTTIGAFGVVAVVERATGSDRMDSFLGLHKRNPLLAAVLLVLFLSLAGIPPLVGFWAKFNLFAAILTFSNGPVSIAVVALAVALSAVSLYYYIQVLKRAYVMPAVDETPIKAHPATMLVLVGIAAAVVLMGCFPALLQNWIEAASPTLKYLEEVGRQM